MKRHKMLSSMELIDDKYIEEASPDKKRKSRLKRFGAIAAAAAIMISSLSAWLFIPFDKNPPDVSNHSQSQYYPLIQKLNELTFQKPNHNNRFELFADSFAFGTNAKEQAAEDVSKNPALFSPESPSYVETTDNQVAGVIEADIIKRSDKHIFYLRNNVLSVYPINGTETECLSEFRVGTGSDIYYDYGVEMYLSEDCSTVNIVLPCYSGNKHFTQIVSLDVTNPSNITEKERVSVSGAYVSSRLTEGKLLLVTNFTVPRSPDFSDESSFIPEITTRDKIIRPAMDSILCPENPTSCSYAVVTMLDPQDMDIVGTVACLSYSYGVYASSDSLYLTRSFTQLTPKGDNGQTKTAVTEITRVAYSDEGLSLMGSVTVKGTVKDQYSLDEYEGVLRVAVTTSVTEYNKYRVNDYGQEEFVISSFTKPNASLYCLDKETFEILAAVENFAPEGERLQSARFDGNAAYICTSLQLSDPVFFFDLSDLGNITVKDTGTIEGFSSSLINFGDGHLLGIGVGNSWNTVKIEVYKEDGDKVISVCSYEIPYSGYSTDYKSYFIDRENWLVGLMVSSHIGAGEHYLLLHFDGTRLVTILNESLTGNTYSARAVLVDDCFYMFSSHGFKVSKLK